MIVFYFSRKQQNTHTSDTSVCLQFFLIKNNPKFCTCSKRQAFCRSLKKFCHQTFGRLNYYYSIRAMLANCNFPIPDRKECLGNTQCRQHATQSTFSSSASAYKCRAIQYYQQNIAPIYCVLLKSKLV